MAPLIWKFCLVDRALPRDWRLDKPVAGDAATTGKHFQARPAIGRQSAVREGHDSDDHGGARSPARYAGTSA